MPSAEEFYEKSTTLTKLDQSGGSLDDIWAFPMNRDANGATGPLAKMDGAPVGAGTSIYFVCDDCADAAKRAKQASGHVVKDKFSIGDYGV